MKKVEAHLYKRSANLANGLAYAAAFVIVVMLVLQLFGYSDTLDSLGTLLPAEWVKPLPIILALIVVIELLALPYFLPLALSRLARICAAACAWLTPLMWLGIMCIGLASNVQASVPLLGDHPDIPLGILPVCLMLLLLSIVGTVTSLDINFRRA